MRQPADPVTQPVQAAADAGPEAPGAAQLARRAAQLLQDAAAAPHQHDFFQLLRALDALHPGQPRLGTARRPVDEPVRLGQPADLAFAAAPLAAVHLVGQPQARGGKPRIDVRFFGLFGPNGPLPLHLTAYARERRLHKGDETIERFADLFHHRLLLLFYRAWAQAQPTASLDRPGDDRFADYVGAMLGVGGAAWRGRDAAPDHARLAFGGVLARQVRNAEGLERLLGGYLGRPVKLESFVVRWMQLPSAERSRIGRRAASRRQSTAQLGVSTVLGRAVFDRQHHFRLHIGPLSLAGFEDLLPVGRALPAVRALVQQYLGLEFGWDLQLELDKAQVPPCRLGQGAGHNNRLGWTTWLGPPPGARPAVLNLVANPLQS